MTPSRRLVVLLAGAATWVSTTPTKTQKNKTPKKNNPKDEAFRIPRYKLSPPIEYSEAELKYASHHIYIDREHKLLYCAIPKVACTEFAKLFFRLKGRNADDGRWRGDPHFRPDKPLLSVARPSEATQIMNDPTWTKFVFLRDPADRLLSAYVDKFEKGNRYPSRSYAVRLFGKQKMNFSEFIDVVAAPGAAKKRSDPTGLGVYTNPHWRHQRYMCNLEKFLPLYNFVGSFARLKEHAEVLLRAVGLWDDYGADGWTAAPPATHFHSQAYFRGENRRLKRPFSASAASSSSSSSVAARDGKQEEEQKARPVAMFERNAAAHRRSPRETLSRYYTPELLARVKRAYRTDYIMLETLGFYGDAPTSGLPWLRNHSVHRDFLCTQNQAFAPCPRWRDISVDDEPPPSR